MPARWLLVAVGFLGCAPPLTAQGPAGERLHYRFLNDKSALIFELPTTFQLVRGRVPKLSGEAEVERQAKDLKIQARLAAKAAAIVTGNARRDRALRGRVLEADKFPEIVFEAKSLRGNVAGFEDGATLTLQLAGKLAIHGKSLPVLLPVEVTAVGDHVLVDGSFPVFWKEWGLRDLSTFYNKVHEPVTIIFRLWGKRLAEPAPAKPRRGVR